MSGSSAGCGYGHSRRAPHEGGLHVNPPIPSLCGVKSTSWRSENRSAVVVDDDRVRARHRLAGEDEAFGELVVLQRVVPTHLHRTLDHPGPAGAAHTAAAGERDIGPRG